MHAIDARAVTVAAIIAVAGAAGAANAEPLEGEWSNTTSWCGQPYNVNNDDIHITGEGYRILESGCTFTGGTKVAPDHWIMKGTCSGEGPDSETPEITLELDSTDGRLTLTEGGEVIRYATKCKDTQ